MANRFVGKDSGLDAKIETILRDRLRTDYPRSIDFFLGSQSEGNWTGIGEIVHKSVERFKDPVGKQFVMGASRWGGSHVVK